MLLIPDSVLETAANSVLTAMQKLVNDESDYEKKVNKAKSLWKTKTSSRQREGAFLKIRETLGTMCIGPVRCSYCEDSAADEIEHIYPKSLFPELAFSWSNYLFACGPCNGPKSNKFASVGSRGSIASFTRAKDDPVVPPPWGISALINPRTEDPTLLIELDLGGVTPTGEVLDATYTFLPKPDIGPVQTARVEYTIKTLGLNREVIRKARENAFDGFLARIEKYAHAVGNREPYARQEQIKKSILETPHLTVLFEMIQQRNWLPNVDAVVKAAPAIATWTLTKI